MLTILAAVAALNWTMPDGRVIEETRVLVPFEGGERLELSREEIRSHGAKRLDIIPDFAKATKGEEGYWFTPYGIYGEYDRDNGRFFAGSERMSMPMFGWSNPRGACLAIVTSLKYFVRETIQAKKGEYTVAIVSAYMSKLSVSMRSVPSSTDMRLMSASMRKLSPRSE